MLALGKALKQRGHRVTFFQVQDVASKLLKAGLEVCIIGQASYPTGSLNRLLNALKNSGPYASMHHWHHDRDRLTDIICREVPNLIRERGIDILIVDQIEPAGATVAEFLGLPFITACNALAFNRESDIPPIYTGFDYYKAWWTRLRNRAMSFCGDRVVAKHTQSLARYRHQWGLPPLPLEKRLYADSQLLQISQQPAAFDFPRQALPDCFHYVGPLRSPDADTSPFPHEKLTGQPLIYASLGTLQVKRYDVFYKIAAACEGLDAQLVLSHGGGMSSAEEQDLPGNPLVVSWAPQLKLLAHASLVITHGGLNTVLDALSFGVPMVAIPIAFEQGAIAARIRWTGAGEVIPIRRLTVPKLRAAVQKVLSTPSYATSALRISQSIERAGGIEKAAGLIESASPPDGHQPTPKHKQQLDLQNARSSILIFVEGMSFAHVIRALMIADWLRAARCPIVVACADRVAPHFRAKGFETLSLGEVDPALIYQRLSRGQPMYTADELTQYFQQDEQLIKRLQPSLIVSEFRITALQLAEHFGIPSIGITEATCHPEYKTEWSVLPDPFAKPRVAPLWLLDCLSRSSPLTERIKRRKLAESTAPFQAASVRYGLKPLPSFFDYLSQGDLCLICDHPALIPLHSLRPQDCYIGPLIWQRPDPLPDELSQLSPHKKTVYICPGTQNALSVKFLPSYIKQLLAHDLQVIVSRGRREFDLALSHPNLFVFDFVNDSKLMPLVDLMVYPGGSMTTYQALSNGVPLIALPAHINQHFCAEAIAHLQLGVFFRPSRLRARALTAATLRLLADVKTKQRVDYFKRVLTSMQPKDIFLERLSAVKAPSSVCRL